MSDMATGAAAGSVAGPWGMIGGAAIGALGSWLSSSAQAREAKKSRKLQERQMAEDRARRAAATQSLQGYNPQAYENPLLSQYLSGQLSSAQLGQIGQQQRIGESTIARRSAGMGMPSGAQAGLYGQLGRDISLGAGQMAGQQQQLGLQYSMADWARQQEAAKWKAGQLAQYAPG